MPSQIHETRDQPKRGKHSPAQRRYYWRSLIAMAFFTIAVFVLAPDVSEIKRVPAIAFTALTALPLIWVAYEFQRYVRALDELQSQIEMQSAAIGFGLTLLIAAIWGLAETFNLLPSVSLAMTLPLGVVLHGAVRQIRVWRLG